MPPPMPNPSKRMTANPARPVGRYRPGKAVADQESSDEESEESEQEQKPSQPPQSRVQAKPQPRPAQAPRAQESEVDDDDDEGFVTDPEDEDIQPSTAKSLQVQKKSQTQSTAPSTLAGQKSISTQRTPRPPDLEPDESDKSDEDEDEDEDDDDSSEESSSSSEEDAPQRKFQRPTFIKKSDRAAPRAESTVDTTNENTRASTTPTATAITSDSNDPSAESNRRLAQAELLIKDKLERDALARLQGRKAWDDDDDLAEDALVDDTDDLDPAAEHAAWKLRELQRLKRDREAMIAREKEIEELERRRNLTTEEREREDAEFIEKQKSEKEASRSNEAQYLARYHHKGAFFQGDEAAEILKRRDVMGAKFEDQVSDKSLLPEYMRLRDMTKLGKKGRTRYTDLKGQDTGRFGDDVKKWRGSGDDRGRGGQGTFDTRGLDERFLPDDQRGGRGGGSGPTGANASAVVDRRDRDRHREGDRDRDRDRDSRDIHRSRDKYSDQDRDRSRERTHSHRRSPARDHSRSRSRSPHPPARRKHSRSRSPESRKRRHVEDYRDRDRDRQRDGDRGRDGDRDRDRHRDRSRDRRRDIST